MNQRWLSLLAVGLVVSLTMNGAAILFLLGGRPIPRAFGQAVDAGGAFIMATEQTTDQTPVCFILNTEDPQHLLVYKLDQQGLLYLTNCRDIQYDLQVPDRYFPKTGSGRELILTRPGVSALREAIEEGERKREQKEEREKEREKKKKKGKEEKKEEEGKGEKEN